MKSTRPRVYHRGGKTQVNLGESAHALRHPSNPREDALIFESRGDIARLTFELIRALLRRRG